MTSLGQLTAASVREDESTIASVAEVTGLSERRVRKRLADAHGKTLVRNVFEDTWPTTPDSLAKINARLARDSALFMEIAAITGLSERTVQKRLGSVNGGRSVWRVFEREWPADELRSETGPVDDEIEQSATERTDPLAAVDVDIERLDLYEDWSRPRRLDRVFKLLRINSPQRLRTPRFQELVLLLSENGVEMQLADGSELFSAKSETPGIHAQVRLRSTRRAQSAGKAPLHPQKQTTLPLPFSDFSNRTRPRSPDCGAQVSEHDGASGADGSHQSSHDEAMRLAQSIAELGLLLSRSDGVVNSTEVAVIRERARRDSAGLPDTIRSQLFRSIESGVELIAFEDAAKTIKATLNLASRNELFRHLLDVAGADGAIVDEEIETLRWLESALVPAPDFLDKMLRQSLNRSSQGSHTQLATSSLESFVTRRPSPAYDASVRANSGAMDRSATVDEIMTLLFSRSLSVGR